MIVLGLESTCDETGCAIVIDGHQILANCVSSQIEVHAPFHGVVPELACRKHIDTFVPLLDEALKQSQIELPQIDLIAVSCGPGLIGALLVGLNFAKGLSMGSNIPFVGVNHIEAHLYACIMSQKENIQFPALGVVVSGGHTSLVLIKEMGCYQLIGQTVDDAIGEAFDKVAALLGLPYPGGPAIEALAKEGDPNRYPFKAGKVKGRPLDFSFSGLKTNVLYLIKGQNAHKDTPLKIAIEDKKDVASSFQEAALKDIVSKSLLAANEFQCKTIFVGGGVSNNQRLRSLFSEIQNGPKLIWPSSGLSLDNAAMIAGLGYHVYKKKGQGDSFNLEALPRIPFKSKC